MAPATFENAVAIQDIACSTRNLKRRECRSGKPESMDSARSLKIVEVTDGEADSYGAALVELVEW
jgi:hypothetical protein